MTLSLETVVVFTHSFAALAEALGWANAVRNLQQIESSRLDYVNERQTTLPDWNAEEMLRQMSGVKREFFV